MEVPYKFDKEAIQAMQDASESYLQELMSTAYGVAQKQDRVTLFVDDMREVRKIRGANN